MTGMVDGLTPDLHDLLALIFAALVGCFIAIAYLLVHKSQPEALRIANACVILTVVICLITRVVQDLATAFIVVGALTLIRLRAAIEDTREFGFLLLSVAAGLGAGERRYAIVLAGAAMVCTLALLLAPRSDGAVEHRLSALLPEDRLDAVRAALAATGSGYRLRLRDAGDGQTRFRVSLVGPPALADELIVWLRSLPDVTDLRYDAEPRRDM